MSALSCGCDPEARWVCNNHLALKQQAARTAIAKMTDAIEIRDTPLGSHDGFTVKDRGAREQYASGMQRDTADNKVDYTLALDGPMFARYAEHLRKGALKYEKRNWMKASGQAELERFRSSALRHLLQWLNGDVDEDHAAAVWFNINGAEYVRARMASKPSRPRDHK